jgi:hypothetical protein
VTCLADFKINTFGVSPQRSASSETVKCKNAIQTSSLFLVCLTYKTVDEYKELRIESDRFDTDKITRIS